MKRSENEKVWGCLEAKDHPGAWRFQSPRPSCAANMAYPLGKIRNRLPLPGIRLGEIDT